MRCASPSVEPVRNRHQADGGPHGTLAAPPKSAPELSPPTPQGVPPPTPQRSLEGPPPPTAPLGSARGARVGHPVSQQDTGRLLSPLARQPAAPAPRPDESICREEMQGNDGAEAAGATAPAETSTRGFACDQGFSGLQLDLSDEDDVDEPLDHHGATAPVPSTAVHPSASTAPLCATAPLPSEAVPASAAVSPIPLVPTNAGSPLLQWVGDVTPSAKQTVPSEVQDDDVSEIQCDPRPIVPIAPSMPAPARRFQRQANPPQLRAGRSASCSVVDGEAGGGGSCESVAASPPQPSAPAALLPSGAMPPASAARQILTPTPPPAGDSRPSSCRSVSKPKPRPPPLVGLEGDGDAGAREPPAQEAAPTTAAVAFQSAGSQKKVSTPRCGSRRASSAQSIVAPSAVASVAETFAASAAAEAVSFAQAAALAEVGDSDSPGHAPHELQDVPPPAQAEMVAVVPAFVSLPAQALCQSEALVRECVVPEPVHDQQELPLGKGRGKSEEAEDASPHRRETTQEAAGASDMLSDSPGANDALSLPDGAGARGELTESLAWESSSEACEANSLISRAIACGVDDLADESSCAGWVSPEPESFCGYDEAPEALIRGLGHSQSLADFDDAFAGVAASSVLATGLSYSQSMATMGASAADGIAEVGHIGDDLSGALDAALATVDLQDLADTLPPSPFTTRTAPTLCGDATIVATPVLSPRVSTAATAVVAAAVLDSPWESEAEAVSSKPVDVLHLESEATGAPDEPFPQCSSPSPAVEAGQLAASAGETEAQAPEAQLGHAATAGSAAANLQSANAELPRRSVSLACGALEAASDEASSCAHTVVQQRKNSVAYSAAPSTIFAEATAAVANVVAAAADADPEDATSVVGRCSPSSNAPAAAEARPASRSAGSSDDEVSAGMISPTSSCSLRLEPAEMVQSLVMEVVASTADAAHSGVAAHAADDAAPCSIEASHSQLADPAPQAVADASLEDGAAAAALVPPLDLNLDFLVDEAAPWQEVPAYDIDDIGMFSTVVCQAKPPSRSAARSRSASRCGDGASRRSGSRRGACSRSGGSRPATQQGLASQRPSSGGSPVAAHRQCEARPPSRLAPWVSSTAQAEEASSSRSGARSTRPRSRSSDREARQQQQREPTAPAAAARASERSPSAASFVAAPRRSAAVSECRTSATSACELFSATLSGSSTPFAEKAALEMAAQVAAAAAASAPPRSLASHASTPGLSREKVCSVFEDKGTAGPVQKHLDGLVRLGGDGLSAHSWQTLGDRLRIEPGEGIRLSATVEVSDSSAGAAPGLATADAAAKTLLSGLPSEVAMGPVTSTAGCGEEDTGWVRERWNKLRRPETPRSSSRPSSREDAPAESLLELTSTRAFRSKLADLDAASPLLAGIPPLTKKKSSSAGGSAVLVQLPPAPDFDPPMKPGDPLWWPEPGLRAAATWFQEDPRAHLRCDTHPGVSV